MTHDPQTRASLILRLQNESDAQAWYEFVEIYQPLIYSLAIRRGLQDADAFDLTQEVLSRVAKSISKWNPDPQLGSFRGWLATITRNMVIQTFRRNQRLPQTSSPKQIQELLHNHPLGADSEDFDLEHERQLFTWAAKQVEQQVEPKSWQAFWRTAVQNQSVEKTAEQLSLSKGAVYIARSRIMGRLRKLIEKADFDSMVGRI